MTLEVADLAVSYGSESVLEDVSFEASDGSLVGLLGPNGSGKTTILRTIAGITEPDAGRIRLDETDLGGLSSAERARRIGYLQQVAGTANRSTVFDTVLLGRNPHFGWRPRAVDHRAVRRILDRLDIEDLATRELGTLSGGQRRTVLLARALVQARAALLLDEPTSGLDIKHQYGVMRRVQEAVQEQDLVGLVAIHDVSLASQFCDRFVLLADGTVHETGGAEVLQAETIEAVYDVPVDVVRRDERTYVVPAAAEASTGD